MNVAPDLLQYSTRIFFSTKLEHDLVDFGNFLEQLGTIVFVGSAEFVYM